MLGFWRVGGVARLSCALVVLVSGDAPALFGVVLVPWTAAILVPETDTVPPRTELVECSTEFM